MSWSQFASLISEDNRNVDDWKSAIEGNPNTPDAALKVAIMHFISCGDVAAIDDFCSFVVGLVNKAVEQSGAADGLHSCLCGDRIPLDEYRCSNCQARETARR